MGASIFEIVFIFGMLGLMVWGYFVLHPEKKKYQEHNQQLQKRNTARAKARGGTHVDHDHIKSTELSDKKKLEQLKTLKEAGLLSQEEFNAAWQKVMKEAAAGM